MNTPRESYSRPELTKIVIERLVNGDAIDAGRIVSDYDVAPRLATRVYYDAKSKYGKLVSQLKTGETRGKIVNRQKP